MKNKKTECWGVGHPACFGSRRTREFESHHSDYKKGYDFVLYICPT